MWWVAAQDPIQPNFDHLKGKNPQNRSDLTEPRPERVKDAVSVKNRRLLNNTCQALRSLRRAKLVSMQKEFLIAL